MEKDIEMRKEVDRVITWKTVEGVIILKMSYEDLLRTGKFLEDFEGYIVYYPSLGWATTEIRIAKAIREGNACQMKQLGSIPRSLMMCAKGTNAFFKIIKNHTSKACADEKEYCPLAIDERIWKDFLAQKQE